MAQNSARNTLKGNQSRLRYLRNLILGSNVSYIFLRMVLRRNSYTVVQFLLWLISVLLSASCFFFLYDAAKPTYDRGTLIDGGYDISKKGWMEYCHDIIYVCCFSTILAIFSKKFWFTLLLIPTYGLYSVICLFISPTNPVSSSKKPKRLATSEHRRRQ
ncbi:Transmembrane protein 208 [Galdieria sulphuraria]|nr:Transmembrane protein 208 [Galdieria sulphuraria]